MVEWIKLREDWFRGCWVELSEFCGAKEINGAAELSLHIWKRSGTMSIYFVESILLFLLFCEKVKIYHLAYTEKISDLIPFPRDIWIPYPATIFWPIPNLADIWIPNPATIFEPIPYPADKKGLIPHPAKPHWGPPHSLFRSEGKETLWYVYNIVIVVMTVENNVCRI